MGWKPIMRGVLCGLAVLLQACAVGHGASSALLLSTAWVPEDSPAGVLLRESHRAETELSEARRAEAECALGQVWGLVRGVDEVGARVEVRFWAHEGTLTLLSHRTLGGLERAQPVAEATFGKRFRSQLTSYVGERAGEVLFTLYRQQLEWRVDFRGGPDTPRPPEAKTQPVRREGVSVGTYAAITRVAGEMVRLLGGPSGREASFIATVTLEDDGVSGWEPGFQEGAGREVGLAGRERLQGELIQALLPFTHGVGPREVRLTLQGVLRPGESAASWRVVVAETLHPETPSGADADLIAEYRTLHESILREWREEVADSGRLAVRIGAEELAFWVVGGVVVHGGGAIFKAVAPRLLEILRRGGARVRGWLDTLLQRLTKVERDAFKSLWERVDVRGARPLSKSEERELRRLAKRLEELVDAPLNKDEKKKLRDRARANFRQFHPELAEAMKLGEDGLYEIHHRCPLEYAHLLVGEDINARKNLVALAQPVHRRINILWAKFRKERGGSEVHPDEVKKMAELIDRHFQRWYDVLYDSPSASALDAAMEMALRDVELLIVKG
ncbi:hypothetical protein [Archangium violaceum]|uniref:Uncharacterized protein n=1 Tax=Archangium violaceum Cb vi76 TaxID=1406225 RepID=A0A084SN25_9BACT|nr:hypothetical protein [Archangium violaceum]KFA89860.1 hypothetical protein Q664_32505 [Archangium violaceum Cb vi76]